MIFLLKDVELIGDSIIELMFFGVDFELYKKKEDKINSTASTLSIDLIKAKLIYKY